ncbi:hypothetical protein GCM10010462_20480 [Microbacterium dextranolyticum]|uniref:Uncharacterized protein n=1 Tax=Microbacterium dextranolyticum TaxID=36806 RepID=A0A9W6M563_9MICO|nr:hypothetical protein GCM10017591_05030 [Microbacterium dextranolyticum]
MQRRYWLRQIHGARPHCSTNGHCPIRDPERIDMPLLDRSASPWAGPAERRDLNQRERPTPYMFLFLRVHPTRGQQAAKARAVGHDALVG